MVDMLTGLHGGYSLGVADGYTLNFSLVGMQWAPQSTVSPSPTPTTDAPHMQLPDMGEPTAGQRAT